MSFADLHLHTVYSDSTYLPDELVGEAAKQGLSAIAVVDHDTVEGIEPTIKAGKTKGIEVIPGIELSAECSGIEIHILGYLIDYKQKKLLEATGTLKKNRIERVHKILDKLNDLGINLDAQAVFDIAKEGTPGRLHIARAMLKAGCIKSIQEAFQKYIGDKSPAYVCGFKLSPAQAIKLIRDAGGIPVLAHPYTLRQDDLIPDFIRSGLMGLEVYYPEHTQSMTNFYLRLAREHDLLVTGGSDCHGNAKPEIKIGSIKIPYELVEKLKEAQKII